MEKPKKYEDRLMEALAFDENDLEANRAGELTQRQIDRLNKERLSTALGGAFILLAGIFAVALGLGAADITVMTPAVLVIFLAMSAFFLGLSAAIWLRSARATADLRDKRAAEVEGRVDLSVRAAQNAASYFLRVGDMRFTVKQQVFLAIKNGDPYRIYYAPRSKRILSVEWLRENDDNLLPAPPDSASITESDAAEADSETGEMKLRR